VAALFVKYFVSLTVAPVTSPKMLCAFMLLHSDVAFRRRRQKKTRPPVSFLRCFCVPQPPHPTSPPPPKWARSQCWTRLRQSSTSQSDERVHWLVEWHYQWRAEMHAVPTMRSVMISCRKLWTGERFVSHPNSHTQTVTVTDCLDGSTKHIDSVKMKLNLIYAVGPYFIWQRWVVTSRLYSTARLSVRLRGLR